MQFHPETHLFLKAKVVLLPQNKRPKIKRNDPFLKSNFDKSLVHVNIICDSCDGPIIGTRYMCVNCSNFDICEKCEIEKQDVHNRCHALLKCRYALPAKIRIQMPIVCEQVASDIKDIRNAKPIEIVPKRESHLQANEVMIRTMNRGDIDAIINIENESFFSPYSPEFFFKMFKL